MRIYTRIFNNHTKIMNINNKCRTSRFKIIPKMIKILKMTKMMSI